MKHFMNKNKIKIGKSTDECVYKLPESIFSEP